MMKKILLIWALVLVSVINSTGDVLVLDIGSFQEAKKEF